MRTFHRLAFAIGMTAMFCGVAAIAANPVDLAPGQCNIIPPGSDKGRGHHHIICDPFCANPCERVVCDGPGVCKWHCEPIPGCVPA